MTHISTVILDDLYVFYKGASKISKMTRYDEFINYFPVEKMAKIVKLLQKQVEKPLFLCRGLKSRIMTYIFFIVF